MTDAHAIRVFPASPEGGNPALIDLEASALTADEMRQAAQEFGHESGFVVPVSKESSADFHFRFFVPKHEMEMCGHATIGALWLLRHTGRISGEKVSVETLSGLVSAIVPKTGPISISQPKGETEILSDQAKEVLLDILKLDTSDLASPKVFNAKTSRVKTLVAVKNQEILDAIKPDFSRIEAFCTDIRSTGLYPFAAGNETGRFHARQFPRASGYPEDAATGIAASALSFGLLEYGVADARSEMTIHQGEVMGCPSEIEVRFSKTEGKISGCWVKGTCIIEDPGI